MNSSDVRIVRLIPTTTDGSFTRASDATFYDAAGVLQTAPPNTLRVTYDPSDLSKAPYALIEPEATNHIRNNTMQGAVAGSPGTKPSFWGFLDGVDGAVLGITANIVDLPIENGVQCIDIRYQGTASANGSLYIRFEFNEIVAAVAGQKWVAGFFYRMRPSASLPNSIRSFITERSAVPAHIQQSSGEALPISGQPLTQYEHELTITNANTAFIHSGVTMSFSAGRSYDFTVRIGLPHLCRDKLPRFPIKTSNGAVTRAADVIGPGAGLLYSSVPITEPLWAAGTYAKGAKVRDAQNFVFESLVDGNTAPLTDTTKTKWVPLGITNRWKAFDKAVNSQTSAPGRLTFSVKPGAVATTMMLLNMEGASVTVSQTDSGYVSTKSLVSHEVDNWYDFYYEEPVRAGDAVFTDIPPFPNAMLTVSIDNGPLESKIGACLIGKPMVIGKATASFKAGVLSYSTSTADTFGNITMVKRYNAPRMNFDVMIPAGAESTVFRILRDYTDTEIGIIVGDTLSMGIGYGYLGQWDVPKSGSGRTAPIEFKGLV